MRADIEKLATADHLSRVGKEIPQGINTWKSPEELVDFVFKSDLSEEQKSLLSSHRGFGIQDDILWRDGLIETIKKVGFPEVNQGRRVLFGNFVRDALKKRTEMGKKHGEDSPKYQLIDAKYKVVSKIHKVLQGFFPESKEKGEERIIHDQIGRTRLLVEEAWGGIKDFFKRFRI